MPNKLKEWARAIKRDVHAIYLAARDPRVPWYAKALALCVAGYALSPIDLIPDFVPIFGYLDDLVIVPLGIVAVVKLIPPEIMAEHRAAAAIASERPTSRMAAAVIALIWVASMALVAWVAYRYFVSASSTGLLTGMSACGTFRTSARTSARDPLMSPTDQRGLAQKDPRHPSLFVETASREETY